MMKKDPGVRRNANFMLGRIYEKFGETPLNRDCAKAYYAMAAKAGHREARKRLAVMKKADREKKKAGKQQNTRLHAQASSSMQTQTMREVRNTSTLQLVHTAQEIDEIGEVIGILDNPVSLVVMDMIGAVMAWDADSTENDGAGVVGTSGT
jgi:TPR repeat protein